MEARALVPESVLASSQLTEVFGSLGHNIIIQLEHHTASGVSVDGDVKEDLGTVSRC